MSGFYICKEELWLETAQTCDTLKSRLECLERSEDKLTSGELRAVAVMKRKLVNFMKYAEAASGNYRMNAG